MTDIGVLGRGRRQVLYTSEERAVIYPHKDAYLKATSPLERKKFAQKVLADIFNHWTEKGIDLANGTDRQQRLVGWIHNNWRLVKTSKTPTSGLSLKVSEVLWKTQPDRVCAEAAQLLGVESADTRTNGFFAKRLIAAKNVIDKMTVEEKTALVKERDRMQNEGFSEQDKRRLAERHSSVRFEKSAKTDWLEMGLLSISFVARMTPDGQLAIEVHDHVSNVMGVPVQAFEAQHPNQVTEVKRLFSLYVKGSQEMLNGSTRPGLTSTTATASATNALLLEFDVAGFPKLPSSLDLTSVLKKQLEDYMRCYLSNHYSIATNKCSQQTPYRALANDLHTYIDPEHLPKDYKMTDPHTMKRGQILAFFDHIAKRQQTYELAEVFRFKTVKVGRKGYKTIDEIDPNDSSNNVDDVDADADADSGIGVRAEEPVRRPRPRPRKVQRPRDNCNENANTADADIGLARNAHSSIPVQHVPGPNNGHHQDNNELVDVETHQLGWRNPGQDYVFPNYDLSTALPFNNSSQPDASSNMAQPTPKPGKQTKKAKKVDAKRKTKQGNEDQALNNIGSRGPNGANRLLIKLLPLGGKQGKRSYTLLPTAPSSGPDQISGPAMVPMPAITNAVIDPALLEQDGSGPSGGTLPNPPRNPINTSDNLALHEASKFMVTGKRERVLRKRN